MNIDNAKLATLTLMKIREFKNKEFYNSLLMQNLGIYEIFIMLERMDEGVDSKDLTIDIRFSEDGKFSKYTINNITPLEVMLVKDTAALVLEELKDDREG